jgi:hypothetical protein
MISNVMNTRLMMRGLVIAAGQSGTASPWVVCLRRFALYCLADVSFHATQGASNRAHPPCIRLLRSLVLQK